MASCSPLLNTLLKHTGEWRYQRVNVDVPVTAGPQRLGDIDVKLDEYYPKCIGVSLAAPFPASPTDDPYFIPAELAVGISAQKPILDLLPWTFWRHIDLAFTERFLPVDLDTSSPVKIQTELLAANAASFQCYMVFALVSCNLYERIQRLGLLEEKMTEAMCALLNQNRK